MSDYTFTRVSSDENAFADGEYTAELQKMEEKNGNYGRTISVEWLIVAPEDYKNRLKWENFNIGSDKPEIREKAKQSLNKFWSQMTDDEDGASFDFSKVLYKEAVLKIKNYLGKDGLMRPYVVHRTLTEKQENKFSVEVPQTPLSTSAALNDELPF